MLRPPRTMSPAVVAVVVPTTEASKQVLGTSTSTNCSMKFFDTLLQTFSVKPIDWDELEATMIRADLGVPMTMRIMDKLQEQEAWSMTGIRNVVQIARKEISDILPAGGADLQPLPGKPRVIVVVGVNGTGKTTSTAKL